MTQPGRNMILSHGVPLYEVAHSAGCSAVIPRYLEVRRRPRGALHAFYAGGVLSTRKPDLRMHMFLAWLGDVSRKKCEMDGDVEIQC